MKGKGRTVVIHPRSIRRTFLGRVVSGRAGGVGGGGGGGAPPPHRSDTSRGHLHPRRAATPRPFPCRRPFFPDLSSLSFHPPRPISSVQRVLLSRAARLCRHFRRLRASANPPSSSSPAQFSTPFSSSPLLASLVLRGGRCNDCLRVKSRENGIRSPRNVFLS